MRQIVLDTETTGLSYVAGDRIVEIGCVEIVDRHITGNNLHLYINPGIQMTEENMAIHGIRNEFLQDKETFAQAWKQIKEYMQGADQLIIHNAKFDIGFLDAEVDLLEDGKKGFTRLGIEVIDTLAIAKMQFPGKRNSLDALCSRFEIDNKHREFHGALIDAQLLAEVWLAMTRTQEGFDFDEVHDEPEVELIAKTNLKNLNKFNTKDNNPENTKAVANSEFQVILPTTEEIEQHNQYLDILDKVSGKSVWRALAE